MDGAQSVDRVRAWETPDAARALWLALWTIIIIAMSESFSLTLFTTSCNMSWVVES